MYYWQGVAAPAGTVDVRWVKT